MPGVIPTYSNLSNSWALLSRLLKTYVDLGPIVQNFKAAGKLISYSVAINKRCLGDDPNTAIMFPGRQWKPD